MKKNLYSPDFAKEIKLEDNQKIDDVIHKSTKVNNKRIIRVIDKIIRLKLNTDIEEDENITKNIIKLRKYCSKLIKKKKKNKKAPISIKHSPSPQKLQKNKSLKKHKIRNRRTIFGTNSNIKISLFSSNEFNKEEKRSRKLVSYKKIQKFLSPNIMESNKNNDSPEKNKIVSEYIKTSKFEYLKEMEPIKEVKEKVFLDKKRKSSIFQTMNIKNIDPDLIKLKENQKSIKFFHPSKFGLINNNSILKKKNILFDDKIIRLRKEKTITKFNEEQKEEEKKKRNKNMK